MATLPDWQLPTGVSRGLWDYLHDADLARQYNDRLAGSPLLEADFRFAERHFPTPGRLLDLGCGTGRLLIPFAQRGYAGTGVDLSPEMLAVARQKSVSAGVAVELVEANLVELDGFADCSFDYVACLFSTLGMVTGSDNRRRAVAHMHRVLKPGGVLVLHAHNWWHNRRDPAGRRWLLRDTWKRWREDPTAGDRVMPPHHGLAGLALHQFTRGELRRLVTGAGFEVIEEQPVGVNGPLRWPRWLPGWRAYGVLLAARRMEGTQRADN